MALKKKNFDVIIIGAGPGGLSSAFWCAELGLKALLLEREDELGGQMLRTFNRIENYLGIETANGSEMRDIFLRQVKKKAVTLHCRAEIEAVDLIEKTVVLTSGERYSARAIVIATGVRRRELGIPGAAEFRGRGILESGEKCKNDVAGKRVMVVGGGDAALENALILSRAAERVFLVHRRGEFRARKEFVHECLQNKKIEVTLNAAVTAIIGNAEVEAVEIRDMLTGTTSLISIEAVLIRVGEIPNTELFHGQISLDDEGYVSVGPNCGTALAGVLAIGDVARPFAHTIAGAVGDGATAAKAIARFVIAAGNP